MEKTFGYSLGAPYRPVHASPPNRRMSHPHHPQRSQAVLMLLLANLFWGLSFPVIKAIVLVHGKILPESGSWFVTAYTVAPRFLLGLLVLIAFNPAGFWRMTPGEFKQGLAIGLFAAVGMLFQNDGLQFTAASTSAFLTQFYAIMIPVYLALRARRSPPLTVWTACALVLAGVAILGRFDWQAFRFGRGEAETLISSVFFMGQIFWLEKTQFAGNRAGKITLVMFATEAVIFWALTAATAPSTAALAVPWMDHGWLALTVVLTAFCTLGAFGIMNAWQPKITATEAGLIYCVEPIFGSAMALFLPALFSKWTGIDYPNEHATFHLLVGGGLITLANVLIQLRPPPRV
jgi:drug/metabolite transporter (DMT)-like permease